MYCSGVEKEIKYDYKTWSVLVLQYRCSIDGVVTCQLNDQSGSLPQGKQDETENETLYIGGQPNKKRANHAVGRFEV